MSRVPIVYVRGFAGGGRRIENEIERPYYGFDDGSVHVRVGKSGEPSFYQSESPWLRLMIDEGHELLVRGSQQRFLEKATEELVAAFSIWVHRFYDVSAGSLTRQAYRRSVDDETVADPGEYRQFGFVAAAKPLLEFIEPIKLRSVAATMAGLATLVDAYGQLIGYDDTVTANQDALAALGALPENAPWLVHEKSRSVSTADSVAAAEAVLQRKVSQWG